MEWGKRGRWRHYPNASRRCRHRRGRGRGVQHLGCQRRQWLEGVQQGHVRRASVWSGDAARARVRARGADSGCRVTSRVTAPLHTHGRTHAHTHLYLQQKTAAQHARSAPHPVPAPYPSLCSPPQASLPHPAGAQTSRTSRTMTSAARAARQWQPPRPRGQTGEVQPSRRPHVTGLARGACPACLLAWSAPGLRRPARAWRSERSAAGPAQPPSLHPSLHASIHPSAAHTPPSPATSESAARSARVFAGIDPSVTFA